MSDLTPSPPPQFGTAEYESAGADHCKFCNQPVGTQYYRVGDAMACASCALRLKTEMPEETGGIYGRALLFGIGAAILGMALYATVTIATGWEIGFVSLAVGWLVGKGIMKGARGFGGRKYQITAVLLTYAAVAMSAVPIGLSQMWKSRGADQAQVANDKAGEAGKSDTHPATPGPATPDSEKSHAEKSETAKVAEAKAGEGPAPVATDDEDGGKVELATSEEQPTDWGVLLLTLVLVGLASPFLGLTNPVNGLIGLVILFVGMQFAWQLTGAKTLVVEGPFDNSATPPPIPDSGS